MKYADAWGVPPSGIDRDFIESLDAALVNGRLSAVGCDPDTGDYCTLPLKTWGIAAYRDHKEITASKAALLWGMAIAYPAKPTPFFCHPMLAIRDLALFCHATNPPPPPPQSSSDRIREWVPPPVRIKLPPPVAPADAKPPRREQGFIQDDDVIAAEIIRGVETKKYLSDWHGCIALADLAEGHGTLESRQKRLSLRVNLLRRR